MPDSFDRLFVLTGGPGAGKSTLIAALAKHGFATTTEAGRAVIAAEQANHGGALPWNDPIAFAEAMLAMDILSYKAALNASGPVFFDRGIPDIVGYLRLTGLSPPQHIRQAAKEYRYSRTVFILPPWPQIYRQDAERRQDFAGAQATCQWMVTIYQGLGYRLVEVPTGSVQTRLEFILQSI